MRLQLLRPVVNAARARALLWPFYCRYPVRCGGAMCSLHKGNHRDDSSENAFGRSSGATRLHSLVQSCTLYSTLYTMNAHLWLFADAECEHCACVCKVNCVVLYTTNGQAKWYSYDPVSFGHQQHTTVVYVNAVLSSAVLCCVPVCGMRRNLLKYCHSTGHSTAVDECRGGESTMSSQVHTH